MNARTLAANRRKQQALCDAWKYPEGTEVRVRKDNGEVLLTKTRSAPWMVGGDTAVILVEGITGGYALERVTPVYP